MRSTGFSGDDEELAAVGVGSGWSELVTRLRRVGEEMGMDLPAVLDTC